MNALDTATVEQMRGVFSELKAAGKTLVITSHDERDIETLCDHVFAMDAGVLTQTADLILPGRREMVARRQGKYST